MITDFVESRQNVLTKTPDIEIENRLEIIDEYVERNILHVCQICRLCLWEK